MKQRNVPGFKHISEVANDTFKYITEFREATRRPLITSSRVYNEKIGGHIWGEQVGIVAASGVGKTGFAIWLMEELVDPILNPLYKDRCICLIHSYEMTQINMFLRSIAKSTNLTTRELLSYAQRLKDEQLKFIQEVNIRLGHLPIYYSDEPKTVDQWIATVEKVQLENPEDYIINLNDHTRLFNAAGEDSERERMDKAMIGGKVLKNRIACLNFMLSQVNNNIETSTDRKALGNNLLVRSDIFGSSSLYQTCESIITLQRPGMYDLMDWRGIPTGLSKQMAGDDNLLVCQSLKAREGNIGVFLMKHNIKYYQFGDLVDKKGGRVKINVEEV